MPRDLPLASIAVGTGALTTSKSIISLGANTTVDSHAKGVQHDAQLLKLRMEFTSIAGGAADVTWNLAADAAGDFAITSPITQTIETGATTATSGGTVAVIESPEVENDRQPDGEVVYLVARLDVGTATVKGFLYNSP